MKSSSFVHLFSFNTAANDAQTLRKMVPVRNIVPDEIKIYGIAYQIRTLQSGVPNLTPWMGVTYSKQLNDSIFWNSSADLVVPGVFHADSYAALPAKDEVDFFGGIDFSFNDTIHVTFTLENLDQNAAYNNTLRLQTIFYYELKKELDKEDIEKWQKIFTNVR